MSNDDLELQFLWLVDKECAQELNSLLKLEDECPKPVGPLLKLKRDISKSVGQCVYVKGCKKRIESNEDSGNKNKQDNVLFYLEFLYTVDCIVKVEKSQTEDLKRFTELFCDNRRSKFDSQVYLKFNSGLFPVRRDPSVTDHTEDLLAFSLGNFVGLNTFCERFGSGCTQLPQHKLTQPRLKLLHDYRKFHLYFVVGRDVKVKRRNSTTHRLHKLEVTYSSLRTMVIGATPGGPDDEGELVVYFRLQCAPLLHAVIQTEDEELDYFSPLEVTRQTPWLRTVDLYKDCPSHLRKEMSMNTVLRVHFRSVKYAALLQLTRHCPNLEVFFAPVSVAQSVAPPPQQQLSQLQNNSFDCFYALQCILTRSYEVLDQISLRDEAEPLVAFLAERSKTEPVALAAALFRIFDAMSKGNPVMFLQALRHLCGKSGKGKTPSGQESSNSNNHHAGTNLLMINRVVLTPSHAMVLPPLPTLKNRALRDSDPNFSLRVSLKDVNMNGINFTARVSGPDGMRLETEFFRVCFKNVILRGISIGNRKYKFVGSSTSQLKGHGMWFYARDPEGRTADTLRKHFGDLEMLREVPKYMARMGQTFSQSMGNLTVPQDLTNVRDPERDVEGGVQKYLELALPKGKKQSCLREIKEEEALKKEEEKEDPQKKKEEEKEDPNLQEKPYTFSDGVGRITPELAEEVYRALRVTDQRPCAMQIRYAGCKGMLAVDPTLRGKKILFRVSQRKFESNHDSLEILKFSERRSAALNRPFITILEQLGVPRDAFLLLQKQMVQNLIASMFRESEAAHFLHRKALLRFDYLALHRAGFRFTEDPLFRSMLYAIFRKNIQLLKDKSNVDIPVDKGRTMFGLMDETFTLEYGQVFVQYTDWDDDSIRTVHKGTVVVTKNPCMHPGDVRKFEAVDVPGLRHIVDCIVFPAKGHRPHPDEMAGSDLDGDEYHVMWMDELEFPVENFEPMDFAIKKEPKELDRPVQVSDELDHFCEYIFNDNVGIVAKAHLVWADFLYHGSRGGDSERGGGGIFSRTCLELAKIYSLALDFAKSGIPAPRRFERAHQYPDFEQKLNEKKTYFSHHALGVLFRSCKKLQLGLVTERNEVECKMDPALVHPEWRRKYEQAARRSFKRYSDKVETYLRTFGFEDEGQLLAGTLFSPPRYLDNRHDLDNLQAMLEIEVQRTFRDLRDEFFREFGGFPAAGFTDDMLQKASAWYVVSYQKEEKRGGNFFGLPWAVNDVLRALKHRNEQREHPTHALSKSMLEEKVDQSMSESVQILPEDAPSREICDNRMGVLDASQQMLCRWIQSQSEYFTDPDIRKIDDCISAVFNLLTSEIVECGGRESYIDELKRSGVVKRAVSPAHLVIETLLQVAGRGADVSPLQDTQQELGLLAWITLVKLACSYNPKYLGVPDAEGESAPAAYYRPRDDVTELIRLPFFEKGDEENVKFSNRIRYDEDGAKAYLRWQTGVTDVHFAPEEEEYDWNGQPLDRHVRVTVQGTRYSVEHFKDAVVMPSFYRAVADGKPLFRDVEP